MYELLRDFEEILDKAINDMDEKEFDEFKAKIIKRLEEID